jgi:hypothetical protein
MILISSRMRQRITGSGDGPVQVELRSVEDVMMFLAERGVDAERIETAWRLLPAASLARARQDRGEEG